MVLYRSDFTVILGNFFWTMSYMGLLFFIPVISSLLTLEFSLIPGFASIGFIVVLSSYLIRSRIEMNTEGTLRHAMMTVVLVWVAMSTLGAIPFVLYMDLPWIDAVFESVSAWTTTGFTVIADVESAPMSILLWRSLMQWLGGIGLVVAVLTGMLSMGGSLYIAEAREERLRPNIMNTGKSLWWIYLSYTVLGVVLLMIAGMPFFDSVNHSMTALATGGMSVKNASIGAYDNIFIEIVIMFLMMLGGISFLSHYRLLKGERRKFIRDTQLAGMVMVLVLSCLLISPWLDLRYSAFHSISAITSTGFGTQDITGWNTFPIFIIIIVMLIGGSSGSTASGIKVFRVGVMMKSFYWNLRKISTPHVVITKRLGSQKFDDEHIKCILIFIVLYLIFIAFGVGVLVSQGYPLTESIFDVVSAQGNMGLTMGLANGDMIFIGKAMLIINMLTGRLEIWSVLVFVSAILMRR